MKKALSILSVLIIMLFVLTGCVSVDYNIKVNQDGSGDISYVYGFEKSYLESSELSAEEAVESMRSDAAEAGYTVEAYSDGNIEGFKAAKHLDNINQLSLSEAFGEENVKSSEENQIKIEKDILKTTYSQTALIDLSGMSGMNNYVTMKYSVNLPVKAGTNNANEISKDGKTLTWNLIAGESTSIEFEASNISILIFVILISIAVIVILIVVAIILRKKKTTNKESIEKFNEKEE